MLNFIIGEADTNNETCLNHPTDLLSQVFWVNSNMILYCKTFNESSIGILMEYYSALTYII